MFLVAEEEDSICFRFNPSLLFISKGHSFDPGHTHLKQQLDKNLKITFASRSKNAVEKNEENKVMTVKRKSNKGLLFVTQLVLKIMWNRYKLQF